jgi:hypothetical protein
MKLDLFAEGIILRLVIISTAKPQPWFLYHLNAMSTQPNGKSADVDCFKGELWSLDGSFLTRWQ